MKRLYIILLAAFVLNLFSVKSFCQVSNDSCQSAIDLGLLEGGTISSTCGNGEIHRMVMDSTSNALPNFPYPTFPNSCIGYTANVIPAGKDLWYKFQVNCDLTFRVQNSDTLHISFWFGDSCSNLNPIQCFTVPAGTGYTDRLRRVSGSTIYMQLSGPNINGNSVFTFCVTSSSYGCHTVYSTSTPTPVTCFIYNVENTPCTRPGSADGSLAINITAGNGPYTCAWSDSVYGLARTSLMPGMYYFTLADNSGCSQLDSVQVGVLTSVVNSSALETECLIKLDHRTSNVEIALKNINLKRDIIREVSIYDRDGRRIDHISNSNSESTKVYLDGSAGVYFVLVQTLLGTHFGKIVKVE